MKLLRVHIISAETCGGLLDGLDLWLRAPNGQLGAFEPLCLIGPNGAGKSQLLQVIAEIFQSIFHAVVPSEERVEGNPALRFEIEYVIEPSGRAPIHVKASRKQSVKRRSSIELSINEDGEWKPRLLNDPETLKLLPIKIVGYTSGDNETLSLPFLLSRSGYAEEVGARALNENTAGIAIPDTRLMLIDYGTHLEVLVANLLFGSHAQRSQLLNEARLDDIHSFRCIVQLNHRAAPKAPARRERAHPYRKGIQLTDELEAYIEQMRRCATCYHHDEKTDTYVFDFWTNEQTKSAFRHFWKDAFQLYSALHKLAMLNDLAIPRATRERFKRDTQSRRFAARLPEPQDENKVFRFERVAFRALGSEEIVDYVSLSDGEHQLTQLLGTFCMVSFPNVLFLLDEPESHFNPQWRVKFISRLFDLLTASGARSSRKSGARHQDCLLTTHAPFVASDTSRDRVFIFRKVPETGRVAVAHPNIETYGTTFDAILEECFGVRPPISQIPRVEIAKLMESDDPKEIQQGIEKLGESVEKVFLADRLREVTKRKAQ